MTPSEKSRLTKSELLSLADAALDAFWRVVASRFPEATTGDLSPPTTVRLATAAEEAVREWISANVPETPREPDSIASDDIDIRQLLKQRRQVAIIWSIEDVRALRPDLTCDQAWQVLRQCERIRDDWEVGFNWPLIGTIADNLFPKPTSSKE